MPARLRFVPLLFAAALGCGLHLHRPRDAATAEGADGDLKASRLVDGFTDELAQSQAMLTDEVAAAQAWAEVGRDRDLLDILGARGEADPEVQILFFTRCRARFKGDGWTTFCSKISTRLHALLGHAFPSADAPAPAPTRTRSPPVPAPAPDPAADLLRALRTLQRHWKGPDSGESRLARAVDEHRTAARALDLGPADAAGPGCPALTQPGASPVLQASVDRQRRLCMDRRDNLVALRERVVCSGPACGPSELAATLDPLLAVHDALQQHHEELSRRLFAYEAAKQPCSAREPPIKGKPELTPRPRPARPAPADEPGPSAMSSETGLIRHVASNMSSGTGRSEPVRFDLFLQPAVHPAVFPGAGLIGKPWLAPGPGARAPTAPAAAASPGGAGACDEAVLQARFAELAEVPIPAVLTLHDLRPLAELGRRYQLAEQLAAVDALIEARQLRARREAAADADPAAAEALAGAPRFARVVHTTITGIDRLQQAVDTFELAVLALIRETLRVEHDALVAAIGHGERRLRLARAKLVAQLDEAALLLEAQVGLTRLERAGCPAQALVTAYEGGKCRDELTRALVAFGNAWTLGRAAQKRADALDLGVRHDASIVRSRAAMAMRQVYLAAGVTELVKFTRGGMAPEALAQLIVSTVGFGVLAGAVLAQ